jgi:hypothetical protein
MRRSVPASLCLPRNLVEVAETPRLRLRRCCRKCGPALRGFWKVRAWRPGARLSTEHSEVRALSARTSHRASPFFLATCRRGLPKGAVYWKAFRSSARAIRSTGART